MIPPLVAFQFVAALLLLGFTIRALRFSRAPATLPFAACMVVAFVLCAVQVLDIAFDSLQARDVFGAVRIVCSVLLGPLWLIMAGEHTTQSTWLGCRWTWTLFVVPLVVLLACLTEHHHALMRSDLILDQVAHYRILVFQGGLLFWLHIAYRWICVALACFMLARACRGASSQFALQNLVIMTAAVVTPDILFLLGLTPVPALNAAPLVFAGANAFLVWSLFRYQALDVVPVARSVIVDNLVDPLIVVDHRDRVVDVNPSARAALGLVPARTRGLPVATVLSAWPVLLQADLEGHEQEVRLGERTYLASLTPLRGSGGDRVGAFLKLIDITERKRLEQGLVEAREAAEAASRAKSDFLANMSHELRTPLHGAMGLLSLLLATRLQEEQERHARQALGCLESLVRLVDDTLDLSRLEAGKLDMDVVAFDVRETLDAVSQLFAPPCQARRLAWTCVVADDVPPYIWGDCHRLRQVMINLVGNAIKFTAQGSVRLEVRAVGGAEADSRLRFEVRDTGIGIPEDKIPFLFQPFTQLETSHARRFGGSGLGLSIARSLCRRMGGVLSVESEVGKGSCFWFELSFRIASRGDVSNEESERPWEAAAPFRILVVDDDATNRLILTGLLDKCGLRAEGAESGVDALEAMETSSFDAVLMDCQMPGMDGYEVTRRLRASSGWATSPQVPVIATTASAVEGIRERCLEAGMVDSLSKPFRPGALHGVLERWLPQSDGATGEPVAPDRTSLDFGRTVDRMVAEMGLTRDQARRLLARFVEEGPAALGEIEEGVGRGDWDGVRIGLHRLKGTAANLRLAPVRYLAASLETRAAEEHTEEMRDGVKSLADCVSALRASMQALDVAVELGGADQLDVALNPNRSLR